LHDATKVAELAHDPRARAQKALSSIKRIISWYVKFKDDQKTRHLVETCFRRLDEVVFAEFARDNGETYLKKAFNLLMCRALNCPSEWQTEDIFPFLFTGMLWKKLKIQLLAARSGNKRALSLFYSLLQSKRTWYALSDEKKEKALKTHEQLLCDREPTRPSSISVWGLKRAVDMIIPRGTKFLPGSSLPTFGAGIGAKRKDGGCHSATTWVNKGFDPYFPKGPLPPRANADAQLLSLIQTQKLCSEWSLHIDSYVAFPRAEVQIIPEPGKFRIITKGEPVLYTAVRPFQHFMLDQWKKLGFGTMSETWEEDLVSSFQKCPLGESEYLVSGDYEAATDRLERWVTKVIYDRVLSNIDWGDYHFAAEMRDMVMHSLLPHVLIYPDGHSRIQKNGQLMGHPLSFPALCIANLATFLIAGLMDSEPFSVMKNREIRAYCRAKGLRINGDDILFKSDLNFASDWKVAAGQIGLVPSVGKNYVSRFAGMINSRLFVVKSFNGLDFVGYANVALSEGFRLKTDPRMLINTLSRVEVTLRRDVPSDVSLKLRTRFLRTHKELLDRFGQNYFLPIHIGGIGIENLNDRKIGLTPHQRKIATHLIDNPIERVLIEKLDELPAGMMRCLRAMRIICPPITVAPFGPINEPQLLKSCDDLFARLSGLYAFEEGAPKTAPYLARMSRLPTVGKWYGVDQILDAAEQRLNLSVGFHPTGHSCLF